MAEEQVKKVNETKEIVHALDGIRAKYPRIGVEDVALFAPVYYPIAVMDMLLEEQTFEDFEMVQQTVLKLVAWGLYDAPTIAQTLGLSGTYVANVLRLLCSYGHIENAVITELGKRSLERGKKIVVNQTRQKFQMDALNGTLLKLGENVLNNTLSDKTETNKFIGHLNYPESVLEEDVTRQISGEHCRDFLRYRSDILHANVTQIQDIQCREIQYVKAYLLKMQGDLPPVIFAKRYDRHKKDQKDRFSWQPFSVAQASMVQTLGLESDTQISTPQANTYIKDLYRLLEARGLGKSIDEAELGLTVAKVLPVQAEQLQVTLGTAYPVAHVVVPPEAISRLNGNLIDFMCGVAADSTYLIPVKQTGLIIRVGVTDPSFRSLCDLLRQHLAGGDEKAIRNQLKEQFRDVDRETPALEALRRMLEESCVPIS